jgi:F0F1-type ATP synthase assembly protein I
MFKIFEIISEVVGWIQIVISPTLLGIVFGLAIYYFAPNLAGMIFGILIAFIGLILGIILATKKYKTTGTINFLSRINATPELDKLEKLENGKKKNSH